MFFDKSFSLQIDCRNEDENTSRASSTSISLSGVFDEFQIVETSVKSENSEKSSNQFLTKFKCLKKYANYLKEYCSQTTLHGIRYIGEKNRHWTERLDFLQFRQLSMD